MPIGHPALRLGAYGVRLLCTPYPVKYVFVESIITGVLPAYSDICHLLFKCKVFDP